MTAHHQPKAPETERAFKEVLYRFMGDVYATKAAMYLKTPGEGWALATQYGFGRRDRLSEIFADDHPPPRPYGAGFRRRCSVLQRSNRGR